MTNRSFIVISLAICFGVFAIISIGVVYTYHLPLWLIPVLMLPGALAIPIVVVVVKVVRMNKPPDVSPSLKSIAARKLVGKALWITLAFVALIGVAGSPLGIYYNFKAAPLLSTVSGTFSVGVTYLISIGGIINAYLTLRRIEGVMNKPLAIVASVFVMASIPAISAFVVVVLTAQIVFAAPLYVLSIVSAFYFWWRLRLVQ